MHFKKAYSFDDVMLVPRQSNIDTRSNVDLSTTVAGLPLKIPIIAANMSSVCGDEMATALGDMGGLGIIHRMCSVDEQAEMVAKTIASHGTSKLQASQQYFRVGFSIGIGEDWRDRMDACRAAGSIVCLDVAHGHHKRVMALLEKYFGIYKDFPIIIAQVATTSAVREILSHIPEKFHSTVAFKTSIGGGSLCTTRIQTGFGIPTLQAVMDIHAEFPLISLIADGGIKSSGDIVKALAAGASAVMLGGLLSGTDETPGETVCHDGKVFKEYRGSASLSDKIIRGEEGRNIEGETKWVLTKGPVTNILNGLLDGVRSGFSYGGVFNLEELQDDSEFVEITAAGYRESLPHARL